MQNRACSYKLKKPEIIPALLIHFIWRYCLIMVLDCVSPLSKVTLTM
jgi:hypothetical protein